MKKREVLELKRRLKKEHITFSRMAGCYVNGEHEKVCTFNEQFLTLQDEEFYKYLEIANKVLSGTIGNNLLNLGFPLAAEEEGGSQDFLMKIRESKLHDEDILSSFYDKIIESYEYVGNYLILLFMDAYDVPMKTTDNMNLGDSEEVFSYFLTAICPVQLSKAGLGYLEEEKRIGSRVRDWVVSMPDLGFLFPSFNERSTDIHETLFYTRDTKAPHKEFVEKVLQCPAKPTANEQKQAFHTIVREVLGNEQEEERDKKMMLLQQSLNEQNTAILEEYPEEELEVVLSTDIMEKALSDAKMTEEQAERIKRFSNETFGEEKPLVTDVLDKKTVKQGEEMAEKIALQEALDEKIREVKKLQDEKNDAPLDATISVTTKEELEEEIRFTIISGKRYLLIPVEETDTVYVNGEETTDADLMEIDE